ncbi:lysophospholipid acyltransferase family protein [Poseidonocella sedimentorum]|uniref:KDO2-lipid IV(A) lauroyltransferase n=1 Tax=Poseidonocella sedimentorum TaxID=871652 RepID=A0A1I6CRD1_9RHOB|nr:lauroyl acyltransferase [Poseidonocella sedimentorum]SFQ95683.1 KDO2-lipid IV(A) lauroyltransferase [Poseidonocella sedimentorum]
MPEKTKTPKPAPGGITDWIVDRLLRGLIALALALPWERRVPLMGWITRRLIAPLAGYRRRAMANLAYVYPDMPKPRRREIADAVADNAGRTMIENYDTAGLLARTAAQKITGPGLAALEEAKAAGRPVMLVTGHFANFEVPRAALVNRGFKIGGLYRPMSNPFFNEHYKRNMERLSGPVFPQGRRGTLGLVKHLKQGGMGILLFDIYDSAGVPMDFLGKPAPTLTSAAEIALRTDALLIPFFAHRKTDGLNFDVEIDAQVPHGDPTTMTRTLTQALEQRIERSPEQWFWIHRRWKPKRQARKARRQST